MGMNTVSIFQVMNAKNQVTKVGFQCTNCLTHNPKRASKSSLNCLDTGTFVSSCIIR